MSHSTQKNTAEYAKALAGLGYNVYDVWGVTWFEYNRFLLPAYLPHATPEILDELAAEALRVSRLLFVRWESDFGNIESSPWWHVIRVGPYRLEQCSSNTRSKVRRGRKRLTTRLVQSNEIRDSALSVCKNAARRYGNLNSVPSKEAIAKKARVVQEHPEVFEVLGVFSDGKLVGFAENHLQENAVFMESIWYDPEYLGQYSSYVLIDSVLSYYLNDRGMRYVSDGARNLYHCTEVHDFLIRTFGFKKEHSDLHVIYAKRMLAIMTILRPIKKVVYRVRDRFPASATVSIVAGLLQQDTIRAECAKSMRWGKKK